MERSGQEAKGQNSDTSRSKGGGAPAPQQASAYGVTMNPMSKLQLRSIYDPSYCRFLFDLFLKCRADYKGPFSKFYTTEVLGTIQPHASLFLDETGKEMLGVLTPIVDEANMKAFRRYYDARGQSDKQSFHQLIHAYLHIKAPAQLTRQGPFSSAETVAKELGGFLVDGHPSIKESESSTNGPEIIAALSYLNRTRMGDDEPRFLIFIPGKTEQYLMCLDVGSRIEEVNSRNEHLRFRYGFCIMRRRWPLLLIRAFHGEEQWTGIMHERYFSDINLTMHANAKAGHNVMIESFTSTMGEQFLRYGQGKAMKIKAKVVKDGNTINRLKQTVARFRWEYL